MGMTRNEAQDLTRRFLRDYPGALELAYRFRQNTAELYGSRSSDVPEGMKAGYISKETQYNGRMYRGRVDVPLDNINDSRDLLVTLRHEVLGHYGANTFQPAEKRALLDGLIAARDEPSLKPLWADIDRRYAGSSLDMRAEEVFSLHCEGVAPVHHIGNDQVQERGRQSFAETCIARTRPMQDRDLHNIACMVAQGLHDRTRTQQNFPQINELFRKDDMESKKPFHEAVAEKLIEQLKAGTAPWQKPWSPGEPSSYLPMNPTTGKRYKGINAIHLMSQGHSDARWMTYKQAAAVGAQVRKGEKGTPVQYWKFSEEQDKLDDKGKPVLDPQGKPVKETIMLERPRVFFATVFNAEQIDGLPPLQQQTKTEQQWDAIDRAEHILKASGARITHAAGDRAFYRPSTDSITMPERSQFETADRYYATALHELGHWTGHPSRLDRDLGHPFGSEAYAKEELRAEIASMILGDALGIGHDPGQHVAYVGSWIKALQEDSLEIFRAAADAEKIHDYVLAFEQKQVQEQGQQSAVVQVLDVDIFEVLNDTNVSFDHFKAFQGATLEEALRSRNLATVGDVTGHDADRFLEVALDRLSPVFGIDQEHTEIGNAYL
jgi:antirestriction protein ArdC